MTHYVKLKQAVEHSPYINCISNGIFGVIAITTSILHVLSNTSLALLIEEDLSESRLLKT